MGHGTGRGAAEGARCHCRLNIETAFSGFEQSGYGREKGIEALLDYSQTKTISLAIG